MSISIKRTIKTAIRAIGYDVNRLPADSVPALDLNRLSGNGRLVAGPFLGEFGWELMQWQGYARQLAKFYKETIVYGRASSAYFYRDFASEYRIVECDSWDTAGYELHNFDYDEWALARGCDDLLLADNRCYQLPNYFGQAFIPFGEYKKANAYDVVLHARNVPMMPGNSEKHLRNWSKSRWVDLCRRLDGLRVAAVGIPELSYCPGNVTDLRGIETEDLCSVLASSKICVGPSSGLMHLATLCRTPQLIWTSDEYKFGFGGTAYRYVRSWNPFATPVKALTQMGINPTVEYVHAELEAFLSELPQKDLRQSK
ncbi:glycosyltransferase family 9 protein [Mycolicibacterium sp. ELW1]|uniref:glycosyltransferase family 9 protein n=1 Tax=Mycobacteriaceae TaxID=1762 RepID=UPI0011EF0F3B|nr:glycosyltransferase family 9 protein [Mycobacterium sp. ELW1]QEN12688.1 glycosyltransferase family 9 protein [Mycobacterium sp. ELW1]